jgi:prepilin-type N-terminal cleavage/methylation domain-containing protein
VTPGPRRRGEDEDGFTLIELLVVIVIIPLVVGAISVALVSVLRLQSGVSNRIAGSADAQTVSANFVRDVQSAQQVTTQSTPQCGTSGSQVLAVSWGAGSTVISYVDVSAGTSNSLLRRVCQGGITTPVSSSVVSHDVPAGESATVTCASTVASCATSAGWITTAGVSGVILAVIEPTSGYSYSLTAVPRAWTSTSGGVPAGGRPVLPLQLLSAGSCSSPVLSITGGSRITVNGSTGVSSACAGAISTDGSTVNDAFTALSSTGISTANSNLTSMTQPTADTQVQPAETYLAGGPPNPFASMAPPTNPGTTLTGGCTQTYGTATCTPGLYTSLPSFNFGATVTFGPGTYVFSTPVNILNANTVSFGTGTYWFEGGLTTIANVTFAGGTYIFGTTTTPPATALDFVVGTVTSTGGVLFYIEGGASVFSRGASITLAATAQYSGVAIWDAGAAGTTNPLTVSGGTSVSMSLGGVYVPSGQILFNGGGQLTATFVVTGTASVSNGTSLAVG